jgi:hypothetical protein
MQERRVTTCGRTFTLEDPFFVLATQNPIEQAGTYPLPEAQLDRFMFNLKVGYLQEDDEVQVVLNTTAQWSENMKPVLSGEKLRFYQGLVRAVPVSDHVARYAVRLAAATRPGENNPYAYVNKYVTWGAGIRGGQQLVLAAKAWALLHGHYHVSIKDIQRPPARPCATGCSPIAAESEASADGIVRADQGTARATSIDEHHQSRGLMNAVAINDSETRTWRNCTMECGPPPVEGCWRLHGALPGPLHRNIAATARDDPKRWTGRPTPGATATIKSSTETNLDAHLVIDAARPWAGSGAVTKWQYGGILAASSPTCCNSRTTRWAGRDG